MRHSTATVIELNAAKRIDFEAVWTRSKKSNAYFGLKREGCKVSVIARSWNEKH